MLDAAFESQTVPATMLPGQTYNVAVTMRNIGNSDWTFAEKHKLGSQGPRDNKTWGINRVRLRSDVVVPAGAAFTFQFTVTAPTTPGTYNFQWRMLQETARGLWFGATTPNIPVVVSPLAIAPTPDAVFVSQSVPTTMSPGATYSATITLRNSGNTTWSSVGQYKLGSQSPRDNMNWGLRRVQLPSAAVVLPGQSQTFKFRVTAPVAPGTYSFQWRMLQEGGFWFGAQTPAASVTVE